VYAGEQARTLGIEGIGLLLAVLGIDLDQLVDAVTAEFGGVQG
jgi:hypothetical protein